MVQIPWLMAPVSHASRRWRDSSAVADCSSVSECGPRSSGSRAVSHSASRPSQEPAPPPDATAPTPQISKVSRCSPSRLTKAATALMLRPSPSTARAVPRLASATRAASASSTPQPTGRQRASSACRPRRCPSSHARWRTCAARVGWV